ncbi:MAG TPA: hypothetical protein VET27_03930 [Mycobacterium sp.]|nr:hypothetical protein [Mycobacterium sp.]
MHQIRPVGDADVDGWSAMIDVNLRDGSIDDPALRDRIRKGMESFGIAPDTVARAIAFAIEQPRDVEIGDITIRPTVQG